MQAPDKGTTIRMLVFVLVWINAWMASQGWYHLKTINEEGVSYVVAFVISCYTWWKNNNITKEAVKAQQYLESLKEQNK